ncbi:hypothetical protein ACFWPA_18625 [Rhodococcus sp. NPDC058505]|uniref:hypothetical protein n=1 Tax=Rhodococcus sp. NPDC058505 TaxID=3346531 RepID=UPI00365CF137
MRGRRIALVVAALIVVVLVLAVTALAWLSRGSAAREAARADALAEGPAVVEAVLSYNAQTVDADLDRAGQDTTGDFRREFVDYASTTVAPQSKERGISTRARVVEAGYLDGTADRARLLMFIDQITTSTAQPAPAATASRVEVTLELDDGRWRIGALTPV